MRWHLNRNTRQTTFRCSHCRQSHQRCSFSERRWGIKRLPTITQTAKESRPAPRVSTRRDSNASAVSFVDPSIPVPVRDARNSGGVTRPGFLTPAGPRPQPWSSPDSSDFVVTLDPFTFVDGVLRDPGQTSTSLANAAIRLRATMQRDESAVATLKMVTAERRKTMTKYLSRVTKAADLLDQGENDSDRMDEDEVEEEPPVASTSGTRNH